MVLSLHLPFVFLPPPILYSWPARLERFWEGRKGASDLATIDGPFPPCRGVGRYASRAFAGSSSFYRRFFAVLTVRSASPLDWAYRGMLVTFLNSQPLANLANSAESYWGPLSERTTSGIPRLVNTDLSYPGLSLGIMSSFFVNSSFSSLRHCFTRPSIWRLRPGHHSALFALALHFVTPWWPSCTRSSISKLMVVGITIRSAFRSNPWTTERSSLVCQ